MSSYDLIVELLASRFDVDPATVAPTSSFEDIDLDSLSQIELATAIKKRFDVDISDDEMAELSTIGEVAAKFDEKRAGDGVSI